MASPSVKQPHVRFASELTVPPADRQRKVGTNLIDPCRPRYPTPVHKLTPAGQSHSSYPKVAQEKGRSKRQSSFDLFWQWDTLTSVPQHQDERQYHQSKGLATEKPQAVLEKRDYATLLSVSRGVPQHIRRQQKFILTCFRSDGLSWATCKQPRCETLRLRRSRMLAKGPTDGASRDGTPAPVDSSRWG